MQVEFHSQQAGDVAVFDGVAGPPDAPGALACQRDLPRAEIVLLEAGRFALETRAAEIGQAMRRFLAPHGAGQPQ